MPGLGNKKRPTAGRADTRIIGAKAASYQRGLVEPPPGQPYSEPSENPGNFNLSEKPTACRFY
jgi:hypothetical protein